MQIKDSRIIPQNLNPIQVLEEARKKLRTPRLKELFLKKGEFWNKVDKFITEYCNALRNQNQSRWGNATNHEILADLFLGEELVPVELTPEQQLLYEELRKEQKKYDIELEKEATPHRQNLLELCQQLRATGEYKKFLDTHRLDPNLVKDPHPSNVRVIAAVSQHQVAVRDLYVQLISRLHEETDSMDDLIKQAEDTVLVAEPVRGNPGSTIDLQKAVSTPNREHDDAWKKSDNVDPAVRRIAIFIVADEGSGSFSNDARKLKRHYVEKPASEFNPTSNPKAYRVDKIFTIKSPTLEEEKRGITLREKIKDTFKQAELFAKQEIENNGGQDLKIEGIAHWLGHGECKEEEQDAYSQKNNEYFEGSKSFCFVTKYYSDDVFESVNEATIKKLERDHLGAFRYFIQSFASCHSGAAIS